MTGWLAERKCFGSEGIRIMHHFVTRKKRPRKRKPGCDSGIAAAAAAVTAGGGGGLILGGLAPLGPRGPPPGGMHVVTVEQQEMRSVRRDSIESLTLD